MGEEVEAKKVEYTGAWEIQQPPVPFLPPEAWCPIFVNCPPFTDPIPEFEVGSIKREVVRQVAREVASWILLQGVTSLKETPDESRAPGIGPRIPLAEKVCGHMRKRFEPKEDGSRENPSMAIQVLTHSLLSDHPGFAGGSGGPPSATGAKKGAPSMGSGAGTVVVKTVGEGGGKKAGGQPEEKPEKGDGGKGEEKPEEKPEEKGEGEQDKEGEDGAGDGEKEEEKEEEATEADPDALTPDKKPTSANGETISKLLPSQRNHGTNSGDPRVKKEDLDRLAAIFNGPLRRFLDLIGRMSSAAWSPPSRTPSPAREDVRGVELGNDLTRMFPTELIRFLHPGLAPMAYLDWSQKRMLQIEMEGNEPQGRGPILIAIDVSPSMEEPLPSGLKLGGSRISLACMIAIALIRIADVQRRKLFMVGFDTHVTFERHVRNPPEAVEAMLWLSRGIPMGNGTKFDAPLLRLLRESQQMATADVLFITDGEAELTRATIDAVNSKRRRGLRVFTLLIDQQISPLQLVSDLCLPLRSEADLLALGERIAQAPAAKHRPQ